jgi:translation elongation factor EF-1beta
MVENGNTVKRIVLGKIAFGFIKLDIEVVMAHYIDLSEKVKELLNE